MCPIGSPILPTPGSVTASISTLDSVDTVEGCTSGPVVDEHILVHGRLQSVPLCFFNSLPEPAVHVYRDVSDSGLCTLHPAERQFLRVKFDDVGRAMVSQPQFSIDVREQLSAAFAVLFCAGGGGGGGTVLRLVGAGQSPLLAC
ncbi:hypothetical protein JG687_00018615 [Phytophthora cactorum]|uniref:Uncharacterized protein n=1 Tax=Phytophthora cactorum TaxID=29920 RepID=A0A8T1TQ64_9STRA|nr:hypothetical protein JG687_00018615 [Phytophthora cactorum]